MSHHHAAIALISLCCAGGLAAQKGARERAIDKSLERAHAELTKELDIWSDHSTIENAWQARSKHFVVRTVESYMLANDIAKGLETMFDHFQKQLGDDYVPTTLFPVVILPSRAAYNSFGEAHGQEHSSFYGSFFAASHEQLPVAAEYHENPTLLRMQITHSVVHQYLHAAYPQSIGRRPMWIEEGLAAYFTYYWDPKWTLDRFLEAKEKRRLPRLSQALRAQPSAYRADPDARLLQLAMLFDYLIRHREDTKSAPDEQGKMRGPFRDYLVAVLKGNNTSKEPFAKLLADRAQLSEDFNAFEFPR
ncbi:MAG: hypothetical protein AB8H80_08430 [Planctomycetota bacterium]